MASRPWTAVPATRSNAKSLKRKQTAIITAIVVASLTGPVALVTTLGKETPAPQAPSVQDPSWVTGFAEAVALDYLAGRPTTLPAARDVDPTFGYPETIAAGKTRPSIEYRALTHHITRSQMVGTQPVSVSTFRVERDDGLYDLSITTITDAAGRTVLAAQPALTRSVIAAPESIDPPLWQNNPALAQNIPQTLGATVNNWARAFAKDDRNQLRLIVGGGPQEGEYAGIGGLDVKGNPQVLVVLAWDPTTSTASPASPNALVRIRVVFTDPSANGMSLTNDYDLLVANYASADAKVQAWGPAGMGQRLKPYQNNTASS